MKKITIFVVTIFMLAFSTVGCKDVVVIKEPDIAQIRSICNLSTLECYFHNVAKSTKTSDSWFKKDREFWIEYTGIAKIGIDMSKVSMEIEGDCVNVILPDAELLSISILEKDLNKDSYIQSEDGWIKNKITADEQTAAISSAQEEMTKSVKSNKALLINAQARAKKLIENYINKMAEISGADYKINWIYESIDKTNV